MPNQKKPQRVAQCRSIAALLALKRRSVQVVVLSSIASNPLPVPTRVLAISTSAWLFIED